MVDGNDNNSFSFPYQPYRIQMEFMHVLYESIKNGKFAIMESPTGTGKSLSTICAALSWLEDDERQQQNETERGIMQLNLTIQESAKDRDWLSAQKRSLEDEQKLEKLREQQSRTKKIFEKLENARRRNKSKNDFRKIYNKRQRSNGSENGQENLIDDKNILIDDKNAEDNDLIPSDNEDGDFSVVAIKANNMDLIEEEKGALSCRKLIYASRTHSQLEQFVKELEKTRFRPRVLTLGSRQILCVNDEVRGLGQIGLMNDRCNELLIGNAEIKCNAKRQKTGNYEKPKKRKCRCEFANSNAIEDLSDSILIANENSNDVQGIAEIIDLGRQRNACPYFASKSALALSQLVLVPYNILLHQSTRQAWNLDVKNNVLIIDEAHNLLQTLSSIHSVELSGLQLDSCVQCLHNYLEKFRMRLNPRNLRNIRQLQTFTLSLKQLLMNSNSNKSENVLTLPQFMIHLGDSLSIDLFRLLAYLDDSKLCQKLRNFNLRHRNNLLNIEEIHKPKGKENEIRAMPIINSTPLYQLREFIQAITTRAEDARIVIDSAVNFSDGKLRFILLNPAQKLRHLVDECHSLILLGGTMRPIDQLMDAFKRVCGVEDNRILEFTCGHVIGPQQLMAMSIGKGPDQTQLNFQYSNRDSNNVLRSLAQTIINLIRHIPNGVVVFFPSYSFLGTFMQSIHSSGHFAQFEKLKSLFVESRLGGEDVWPSYSQAALTHKGAILLAVVNGKLSEGINFSDDLGRCVLMVGMPFANKNSPELQERMKFVDEKIGLGAGNRFYEQLCLQSLNQAIGRVIRHKNDYAAILLLDERFTKANFESGLPGWIRQRFFHATSFADSLSKLIKFFKSHPKE